MLTITMVSLATIPKKVFILIDKENGDHNIDDSNNISKTD